MDIDTRRWFSGRKLARLKTAYIIFSLVVVLIDLFIHQHQSFGVEDTWLFYGVYGLVVTLALIGIVGVAGALLRRKADYYED